MTIEDLPESNLDITLAKPSIGMPTIFRLGLFNMGLGLMAVLTLAVLNRVMISELAIPATVTGGILATSLFVSPARVWFGQLSDNKPLWGKHRTNYVLLGTAIFGLAVFLAVQAMWQLGGVVRNNGEWLWNTETIGWSAILCLIMAIYGLAVSSSSTPFTALLVDITEEERRSKLIAIVWSMLMVGIVIGGITGSIVFKKIEAGGVSAGNIPLEVLQPPINSVFAIVPFLVVALAFVATFGVENKYSSFVRNKTTTNRDDSITIVRAMKVLTTSRQTGIFFTFLSLLTIGLFMQEAVLEPYGGEVFGMSIGETTKLNAYWGMGILFGYAVTGFKIIPYLGKKKTTRIGCIAVALCFGLIILAGFTQQPKMLQSAMVFFGIAAGIATVGGISLMLDLTAAETAGTFIGAWGLAQAMSRGLATLIGGAILDIGKSIFATPLMSYSLVFVIQALGMFVAIAFLERVNVKEFKENTQQALSTIMEGDLDG
ncbi:BCD family MFS transporter [Waterburya agarophytonicola K14]|uniref:BCD family MFS transporter n=1 Tax=Waterburya agarophytonicola KI4 TaxID=2874699 RepID=A0A964BT46_9CYAN|nr:BCD family MFS transporter [Waterburya agarophytonicola]MCC0178659.1 BCD family MFS transporter [Waterburya agarophytonicola KI4]